MKEYWKQHWFEYVFSTILVGVTAVAVSLLFGYSFSTNDDAMLRSLVSGNYTGEAEAHLIYIMYPLGLIGKTIYRLVPTVPWYDIFMTVMHYLCWILVIGRIGEQFTSVRNKSIAVMISYFSILLIDAPYVMMHQYTILAAWFAAVAILFLLTSKGQKGLAYWTERCLCLIFLVLCLWLRKQVFILALPIGLLIMGLEFCRDAKLLKERKVVWNKVIFIGAFIVLTLASFGAEKAAYASEEWQEFLAYNEARTDIYDYYGIPSYIQYEAVYEKLGFSYADYLAIDLYNSELVNGLHTPELRLLADTAKQCWESGYGLKSVIRIMVESVVREVLHNPVQPMGIFLTALYLLVVIACVKNNRRREFIGIAGLLLFQFAVVGYFAWRGRFPERVSYGLYLMAAAFLTGILLPFICREKTGDAKDCEVKRNRFWLIAAVAGGIFITGSVGLYRYREIREANEMIQKNYQDWVAVNEYFSSYPERKFCIDTYSFVFSTELMFDQNIEKMNVLRLGTWVQASPLQEKRYRRNEINQPLALVAEEDRFYYVQLSVHSVEWLEDRWQELGYQTEPVIVDTIVTPSGRSFDVIAPRALDAVE